MKPVKLGLIGLGHIGRRHAESLLDGRVPGAELAAVATSHPEWIQKRAPDVRVYPEPVALLHDSEIEGVLVCTPHRLHVPQAIEALRAGKHVLIEKPVAADWSETEALCRARDASGGVVGVMFHLRTNPVYRRIKELLQQEQLGQISRVAWTMTAWSRDQAYYDQADWRGTWAGEGGGVLLNQCAHHLDLLCWYFGMPTRLQAVCGFGKHHRIEVEDEATLLLEYPDGSSAVFTASTGEPRGENRLEIIGSQGDLLLQGEEDLRLRMKDGEWQMQQIGQAEESEPPEPHVPVIRNFVGDVRGTSSVWVSVEEAVCSLRLANAAVECVQTGCRIEFFSDESGRERT